VRSLFTLSSCMVRRNEFAKIVSVLRMKQM
jgi:hypothetical protein